MHQRRTNEFAPDFLVFGTATYGRARATGVCSIPGTGESLCWRGVGRSARRNRLLIGRELRSASHVALANYSTAVLATAHSASNCLQCFIPAGRVANSLPTDEVPWAAVDTSLGDHHDACASVIGLVVLVAAARGVCSAGARPLLCSLSEVGCVESCKLPASAPSTR